MRLPNKRYHPFIEPDPDPRFDVDFDYFPPFDDCRRSSYHLCKFFRFVFSTKIYVSVAFFYFCSAYLGIYSFESAVFFFWGLAIGFLRSPIRHLSIGCLRSPIWVAPKLFPY